MRRILTTELGLGGFEMLKLSVFRGQSVNDEESRFLFEIARHLELLPNLKAPGVAWYQPEEFPFTQALKEAYPMILEEFKRLEAEHLVAWPEKYLCKKGWDVRLQVFSVCLHPSIAADYPSFTRYSHSTHLETRWRKTAPCARKPWS